MGTVTPANAGVHTLDSRFRGNDKRERTLGVNFSLRPASGSKSLKIASGALRPAPRLVQGFVLFYEARIMLSISRNTAQPRRPRDGGVGASEGQLSWPKRESRVLRFDAGSEKRKRGPCRAPLIGGWLP